MEGLIMTAQLLLGLSIIVGIHELGHMIAAKYFGMRVEKYSIGFPPKIFSIQKGETEYSLGSIPLGGFVKISGMVDESLDTEKMKEPPKPWEFRAKPAWQRLIVMMGGIIMNIVMGIFIFICMTFFLGEEYISGKEAREGIVAHELAQEVGLQTGDKIMNVNGRRVEKFNDLLNPDVLLGENSYYTIKRDETTKKIEIPSDFAESLSSAGKRQFVSPITTFSVGKVLSGKGADKAGLKKGDQILKVNDREVKYFHEIRDVLQQNQGKTVNLTVKRGDQTLKLEGPVDEQGMLGFRPELNIETEKVAYGPLEAVSKGTVKSFSVLFLQIRAFGKMFSGDLDVRKSLSGPIGIAQEFGPTWNWQRFWSLTGVISLILAFMNFLPIPALDGGHVMFLTYEIVTRRKPSDKFMEVAQKAGMIILLSIMAFVIYNDVVKTFF